MAGGHRGERGPDLELSPALTSSPGAAGCAPCPQILLSVRDRESQGGLQGPGGWWLVGMSSPLPAAVW